jgi:hypothetical protein
MDVAFSYGVPFTPRAGRDDPIIEKALTKICAECKKRGIPVRFSVGVALLMQGARHYVNTLEERLKEVDNKIRGKKP